MTDIPPWLAAEYLRLAPSELVRFEGTRPIARIDLPVPEVQTALATPFSFGSIGPFLLLRLRSGVHVGLFTPPRETGDDFLLVVSPDGEISADRVVDELSGRGRRIDPARITLLTPSDIAAIGQPEYEVTPRHREFDGEEKPGNTVWNGTHVAYLDHIERQQYRLTARQGRLYDSRGHVHDTGAATTLWTPQGGRAIFVMGPDGTLYSSSRHILGRFHHSSFLAGTGVAGAGEIQVDGGCVRLISDHSTHYRPARRFTEQVLHSLRRQGVDTTHVRVEYHQPPGGGQFDVAAAEFADWRWWSSPAHWAGVVRRIFYSSQFDRTLDDRVVARIADMLLGQPSATPEADYEALAKGLRCGAPLSWATIMRHDEPALREFLARIAVRMDELRPWPEPPHRTPRTSTPLGSDPSRDAFPRTRYATTPMRREYEGEELPGNPQWNGKRVRYFEADERRAFVLRAHHGLLIDSRGRPFHTAFMRTLWTPGGGRAIFVMDEYGTLYASPYHVLGEIHSSSLLAGAPVAAAGEITVTHGVVQSISDQGDHYRPARRFTAQVIDSLGKQGIDTTGIHVECTRES